MSAPGPDPGIDAALVRRLLAAQFPHWAVEPVEPVEPGGWDNRTFRLGDDMGVRLPSAERYAAQIEMEQRWLPKLAPRLPVAIPAPLALGTPDESYPWPWSIRAWIEGETAAGADLADRTALAANLAGFLRALHAAPSEGGPPPGPDNFHRGGDLAVYDRQTRRAMAALEGRIDAEAVGSVWNAALAAAPEAAPVWVHGDLSPGNLLVREGPLAAVIDFGQLAVGDPACDLAVAWTFFSGASREAFRAGLPLDPGTWARARGWTLWKALIVWAALPGVNPMDRDRSEAIVRDLVEEHRRGA